jgi:O-methyltransferase
MVHDFNNLNYKGVREAVLEFCREKGISYVPIPDIGGTVIITKNWRDKE